MPLGEFLAEVIVRTVFEIVFCGLAWLTGAAFLKTVTLGSLELAPLDTYGTLNRGKSRWNDWSPWLKVPGTRKSLRAEWVCVTGICVWIAVGIALWKL